MTKLALQISININYSANSDCTMAKYLGGNGFLYHTLLQVKFQIIK